MPSYHYNDPLAPSPTRIHIGTAVAIWNNDRVLLDHRRDGQWGLIGGALELGESLEQCVNREADEETGLKLDNLEMVGCFSNPTRIIARDELAVQSVTICFSSYSEVTELRLSHESREANFFSASEIESLDIVATHKMIVPYLFQKSKWPIIK